MLANPPVVVNRHYQSYTVSIQDAIWRNKFFVDDKMPRGTSIGKYRQQLKDRIECFDLTIPQFMILANQSLGCTCKPKDCHGDAIVDEYKVLYEQVMNQDLSSLPDKLRVIVCGGRKYKGKSNTFEWLNRIREHTEIELIIEGGATGPDYYGALYGYIKCIKVETERAHWKQYGNGAGHIRNQAMIDKYQPNAILAMPGNSGTADMVKKAKKHGLHIIYGV